MSESPEKETIYECDAANCGMKFDSMHEMVTHINQEHGDHKLQGGSASSSESLPKSTPKKVVLKKSCEHCGRSVMKKNMYAHVERCTSTGEKLFNCEVKNCKSSFATQVSLQVHLCKVHKALIKCDYEDCDVYLKPNSLVSHKRSVHEKKKETCQNCGKRVSYKNLKQHQSRCISTGEKKIPCTYEYCTEFFTTTSNRSVHINRVHKNSIPIKCPREGCNVMIYRRSLHRHIKEFHEKLKKTCPICNIKVLASVIQRHRARCLKRRSIKEAFPHES